MRWRDRRQSVNVEDLRTRGPGRGLAVGGGLGFLVLLGAVLLLGGDPRALLDVVASEGAPPSEPGLERPLAPEDEEAGRFAATILADTEDVWGDLFEGLRREYEEPTLVLFRDAVRSACGMQAAAVGPFYCPGDARIYIDLDFFDTLAEDLDAPGDFAEAYVVAHEVGHHVQKLLGISDQVEYRRLGADEELANELSVRLELQADFLAGVWAHHAQRAYDFLEPGDLEEALHAASQIGDDTLQRRAQGRVMPDSFTHGSAKQRARWFYLGFETGDLDRMDTFAVPRSQL